MAKKTEALLLIAALFVMAGCGNHETKSSSASGSAAMQSSAMLTPEDLGELGGTIHKNPSDAKRLLEEHGLTDEAFAAQVRKVAEDPAASKRYAAAYNRAGA